ncbi:MAG TPA: ABC transporter permease subunit [Anaerolineae bacterium]|nr:ABC transporter permease subunit [Anaerolineae bacterium]
MASNSMLQPVTARGWRAGFNNLFRKENRDWWGTRSWLKRAIVWTAILIGILASVLFAPMEDDPSLALAGGKAMLGLMVFFVIAGMALAIGTIIMGQEEVLDEKRSGTVAWVLSKPVSRSAFILAKILANAIGILIIMVLLEGVLAYGLIAVVTGTMFPVLPYLGALGVLFVEVMFYFLLALMFSTVSNSRGAAIGIPLAILLGYQFIVGVVPWTLQIMPWGLTNPGSGNSSVSSVVMAVVQGQAISVLPIVATLLWCLLFAAIAVWKFNRDEF